MLILKNSVVVIILLTLVWSCNSTSTSDPSEPSPFFDLKAYFSSELGRLENRADVRKTVAINGQEETRQVEAVDWSTELAIFSKSDINRLAWSDKYRIDSIHNDNGMLTALKYTAANENMRTQVLYIGFRGGGEVDSIFIDNQVIGFATQSRQELVYLPRSGYSINSVHNTLFTKEQTVSVEVFYEN